MSTWMDEELAACRQAMNKGRQAHQEEVAVECHRAWRQAQERAALAGTEEAFHQALADAEQARQRAEDATAGPAPTLDALWASSQRDIWAEQEQRRQSHDAFRRMEAERRRQEWEQTAGDPRAVAELIKRRHGGLW